jgi:quinolinate synthase
MLKFARESESDTFIVATETGMLHPLEQENPGKTFVAANEAAVCKFMKMITLTNLRDCLRNPGPDYEVKVPEPIATRARIPIERMVAIKPRDGEVS